MVVWREKRLKAMSVSLRVIQVVQNVELQQCEPLLLLLTMRGDVKARRATRDWVVAAVRVIVAVMVSSELSKSRLRRVCTRYRQLCADRMNVVHGERGAG